jgi:hypothetical protein
MSFLYPRTVDVHRPAPNAGTGGLGYSGEIAATESVVKDADSGRYMRDLPASIQHRAAKGKPMADLPADAASRADWFVFIPNRAAALGSIAERDVIVDDLGERYQVVAAYWNSLGYRLAVELLQM